MMTPARILSITTCFAVPIAANMIWPCVRLHSAAANHLVVIVTMLTLFIASLNAMIHSPRPARLDSRLLVAVWSPLAALGSALLGASAALGYPEGVLVRLQEVSVEGTSVVVYREDYGVVSEFGIVVRQESELIPGVLVVREMANRQADGAQASVLEDGRIQVVYVNRRVQNLNDSLVLNRFVWF